MAGPPCGDVRRPITTERAAVPRCTDHPQHHGTAPSVRPGLGRHEEAPRTGHWAPGGKRAEPGNGRQDEERRSEAVSWLSGDR